MKHILASNWDLFLVRGILAILFGIGILLLPGITVILLVGMFGAYALVDGIILSVIALKDRKEHSDWWLLLLTGLVNIGAGVVSFVWPRITAISLFYVIVAWAIATGIFEVIFAIRFRKEIEGEGLMVLNGIVSIAFGILLVAQHVAGVLAVLWIIGSYAIAYGAMLVVLAFWLHNLEVKNHAQQLERHFVHQP